MKLLVIAIYIAMLVCMFRTLEQSAKLQSLKYYRPYNRRQKTKLIKTAKAKLTYMIVQLIALAGIIITLIALYHGVL